MRPYFENIKRAGGVDQGIGPEFKLWYYYHHQKKNESF
jgi:hypothetical protein